MVSKHCNPNETSLISNNKRIKIEENSYPADTTNSNMSEQSCSINNSVVEQSFTENAQSCISKVILKEIM